jgi:hypothetical protein
MRLKLDISGDPAAYFDALGEYSKMAFIEQSSKAGAKVKDSVRREFDTQVTNWDKEYQDGVLKAVLKKTKLGMRISHKNKTQASPESMKSFIQSFTNTTTGTTVIMGAFRAYNPIKIRNGKVIGYEGRQSTVTRASISILEKLNSGQKSDTYAKYFKRGVRGQFRGKQPYVNRRWAEAGFAKAETEVKADLTTRLLAMIANYDLQKGKQAI